MNGTVIIGYKRNLSSGILACILRVYQINDGIVLDFRLVLSDIGRYGRRSRVIHILQ